MPRASAEVSSSLLDMTHMEPILPGCLPLDEETGAGEVTRRERDTGNVPEGRSQDGHEVTVEQHSFREEEAHSARPAGAGNLIATACCPQEKPTAAAAWKGRLRERSKHRRILSLKEGEPRTTRPQQGEM